MNFFEAQDRARRNTSWLILLFILAVLGLIVLTNLLLVGVLVYSNTGQLTFSYDALRQYYSFEIFVAVAIGVSLLIFAGSLYKTMSLSGGGASVAEMLGGRLIAQSTRDLQERQLLNVVEEMAIASGSPIPKVYLLDEDSINAFAAGETPSNAVIGVTYGTLTLLNREELQAVIAHEFSHIFNGDMRLNIRLIGMLHGILLIGMIGYFILRSMRFSGRSRSRKGGGGIAALLALGGGLMVIGYVGTFFGQWIKAVISRQREYLADSSAVQFTRNKAGIAGALKKIGGLSTGSYINAAAAPEYSHAYFANGISSFWQSLLATHPPLESRIRAIDPGWDGKFITAKTIQPSRPEETIDRADKIAMTAAILSSAEQAINQIGTLNEENIDYVQQLIVALPPTLRKASQEPFSARAVIYGILICQQSERQQAQALLVQHAEKNMPALVERFLSEIEGLNEKLKLPLLELSINALKELSTNQYIQFKRAVNQLIVADKTVDLNEWVIQRLVIQQLNEHFGLRKPAKSRYPNVSAVKKSAEEILSLIAHVEHKDENEAESAFNSGLKQVGLSAFKLVPRSSLKLASLNQSLDQLMQLKPLAKPRLLKACVAIIMYDGKTTTKGIEFARTISSCLDCPMPPLPA